MAQTTILAAGQTAASSSAVVLATGDSATFSIVPAAGQSIPRNISLPIRLSGSEGRAEASLNFINPVVVMASPGAWVVDREDISAYGVDITVLVDQ